MNVFEFYEKRERFQLVGVVGPDSFFVSRSDRLSALAVRHSVPAVPCVRDQFKSVALDRAFAVTCERMPNINSATTVSTKRYLC